MGTKDKTLRRRYKRENDKLKEKVEKLEKELEEAGDTKKLEEKLDVLKEEKKKLKKKLDEMKDLSDLLTKDEAKAVLSERDEKTSGKKADLIKRIKDGS